MREYLDISSRVKRDFGLSICVLLVAILGTAATTKAQAPRAVTGAVKGYVYCADTGLPARFVTVRVQAVQSIGDYSSQGPADAAGTTTGLDGSFIIDALNPGDYVVSAYLPGYLFPLAQFTWRELVVDEGSSAEPVRKRATETLPQVSVQPGQTAFLTIRLERGAEISGTVSYDDGSAVIGAPVRLYRFSETNHEWQTVEPPPPDYGLSSLSTGVRGAYAFTGLPSGQYLVSVLLDRASGSGSAILGGNMRIDSGSPYAGHLEMYFGDTIRQKLASRLELSAAERRTGADIQIPASKLRSLSGTVVAEFDGHPLKAARLQLSFADDKSTALVAHAGDDGMFQMRYALDGDYILTVSVAGETSPHATRSYSTLNIPVTVNGDISGMTIVLPDAPSAKSVD